MLLKFYKYLFFILRVLSLEPYVWIFAIVASTERTNIQDEAALICVKLHNIIDQQSI